MSYSSGSKNPPWQRNNNSLQPQMNLNHAMFSQQQQVYNQIQSISQPQAPPPPNISLIATQMTGAMGGQIFTTQQSYQTPPQHRNLNPIAFQAPVMQQQQQQQPQSLITSQLTHSQAQSTTHRMFNGTGVVTKIEKDIGYIDEEIFFHKAICRGSVMPKVGDHVLVETSYSQSMPFKWNATLVQIISSPMPNTSTRSSRSVGGNLFVVSCYL